MDKKFDEWNDEKKKLESDEIGRFRLHEREIWWCSLGLNIGDEEDGKNDLFERPVLVVRKFNNRLVWVVPMTTATKHNIFHHVVCHDNRMFSFMLSQIRPLSIKRFRRFIRILPPYQFALVKAKIILLLG